MSRQALEQRVRHFYGIRSARRALARSASGAADLPAREELVRVGEQIVAASRCSGQDLEVALDKVDTMLRGLTHELREASRRLDFSQIRSAMARDEVDRDEELGLLAVLASGEPDARSTRMIEYLATWLASDRCGDVRHVARDPVALCPALAELCASRMARMGDAFTTAALERVREAISLIGDTRGSTPISRDMREYKESLGDWLFDPELFRAIVDYNVAAWNHREESLAEERMVDHVETADLLSEIEVEIDLAEAELTAPTASAAVPEERAPEPQEMPAPLEAPSPPEPEAGASTDLEAARAEQCERTMVAVARAFGDALEGRRNDSELIAAIVDALDASRVPERHRSAFQRDATTGLDELLRRIVVTGLMIETLSGVGPALRAVGIAPAFVRTEWVLKLGREQRQMSSELIAAGRLKEARTLTRAKNDFLSDPLAGLIRDRSAERLPAKPPARLEEAPPKRRAAPSTAQRIVETAKQPRSYALLLAVAVALAVVFRFTTGGTNFQSYGTAQLVDVSPYIVSAYRGKSGEGGTLLGRLSDDWNALPVERRIEEAREIASLLAEHGVREVMLYDAGKTIALHTINGTVRIPAPPAP